MDSKIAAESAYAHTLGRRIFVLGKAFVIGLALGILLSAIVRFATPPVQSGVPGQPGPPPGLFQVVINRAAFLVKGGFDRFERHRGATSVLPATWRLPSFLSFFLDNILAGIVLSYCFILIAYVGMVVGRKIRGPREGPLVQRCSQLKLARVVDRLFLRIFSLFRDFRGVAVSKRYLFVLIFLPLCFAPIAYMVRLGLHVGSFSLIQRADKSAGESLVYFFSLIGPHGILEILAVCFFASIPLGTYHQVMACGSLDLHSTPRELWNYSLSRRLGWQNFGVGSVLTLVACLLEARGLWI